MMRKKLLCILGISILLVGCGKEKEQYPEVAGEYYAEDDTEIILYADGTCHAKVWAIKDESGTTKRCIPQDGCTEKSDRFIEEVSDCTFTLDETKVILTMNYYLNGDYTYDYSVINNYEMLNSRDESMLYVKRGTDSDQAIQEEKRKEEEKQKQEQEEYEQYQEMSRLQLVETITPDYIPHTKSDVTSWWKPVSYCDHKGLDTLLKENLASHYLVEIYANQLGKYVLKVTDQHGNYVMIPLGLGLDDEYSSSIMDTFDASGAVVVTADGQQVHDNYRYGFPETYGEVSDFICKGTF